MYTLITQEALALANAGKGVDADGYYGFQCVDLDNYFVKKYTGRLLGGNAIDLLNSAKNAGFVVEYNKVGDLNSYPKPGAFFVMSVPYHRYGHTGVVISADAYTMTTVEQNIDGNVDALQVGAPARHNKRDYTGVIGWFYIPEQYMPKQQAQQPKQENKSVKVPTKNINGDLFSGHITGVDPNIMNADSNRTKIDRIVIHHNAGTNDAGARRTWYVSTGIGTSAHYQVTPDKIWGCVGENFVAYHAGNYPMNQRSIGIEHLNNAGAPNWTIAEETYRNSAKLIRDICERYGIPMDRQHILGHREVSQTACPGGIDIDKLITMAKGAEYVKPTPATPKPNPAKPAPKMQHAYRIDELKFVNGLWQVRCDELVPVNFNWVDNGVAVEDIIRTDKAGNRTPSQIVNTGDYFVIDQSRTSDTGVGGNGDGGYYWRKFNFRTGGAVWLSAWNAQHLFFG